MRQIRLGEHPVSRLICGDNPFKANSHLSVTLNQHMRRFYRPDQIIKTLRRCEQVGINGWQAIVGMYNEFNDEPAENAELVRRYGASLAKPT